MGWVLLLSLRFKSPGVHKWQCSKSINIVLREYYWQLRWPRKKPLDRRSMIKASMVTDCRLGMYTTVASGGSERGHNAMFLVYGAGAHPSRMGDFRESYNVKPFPWSRDTGAQKRRWVSEWRRRDAHVPGLTLTEHGLTQKSKCMGWDLVRREKTDKKKRWKNYISMTTGQTSVCRGRGWDGLCHSSLSPEEFWSRQPQRKCSCLMSLSVLYHIVKYYLANETAHTIEMLFSWLMDRGTLTVEITNNEFIID